jgi:hypothetical protein
MGMERGVLMNQLRSKKGYTLLLVLGFVLILALVITPLAVSLNVGYLQAVTDGHSEAAFIEAESAATVYKRIFAEATAKEAAKSSSLTDADARELAMSLASARLFPALTVAPVDQAGVLKSVQFAATSGDGPQKRGRVLALGFEQVTTTTTETVTEVDGNTFYNKHGVVVNRPKYNYIFTPPAASRSYDSPAMCTADICNSYTGNYAQEFNDYLQKYIGADYPIGKNAMMTNWQNAPLLAPLPTLAVPDQVLNLPSTITQGVNAYQGSAGLRWAGDVNLVQKNTMIGVLASGNSMEVAGNLTLPEWSGTTFQGGLQIGGDFLAQGNGRGNGDLIINGSALVKGNLKFTNNFNTIRIKGDLLVKGNIEIPQATTFLVDGSIIAGGNITLSGPNPTVRIGGTFSTRGTATFASMSTMEVGGDLLAAKNLIYSQTVSDGLYVTGAISAGENLSFAYIPRISAGAWTTSWAGNTSDYLQGKPQGNNRQPVIAGKEFKFTNTVDVFRATGDFSSQTFSTGSTQLKYVRIGGSWLAGSSVNFNDTVDDWWIGGNLHVDNIVHIQTTPKLIVDGSIYAKNGFSVENAITKAFTVGGSLLSLGKIKFANTIEGVTIAGDMMAKTGIIFGNPITSLEVKGSMVADGPIQLGNSITRLVTGGSILSKSSITFNNTVNTMQVGGSLVAGGGNLVFNNDIGSSAVSISGDLIAAGNMSFRAIQGLTVTGMAAALRDMTISLNVANPTKLGGFYAGGTTTMASWYGASDNQARQYIKITHVPFTTTTTRTVTVTSTKASTKWTSRLTHGTTP